MLFNGHAAFALCLMLYLLTCWVHCTQKALCKTDGHFHAHQSPKSRQNMPFKIFIRFFWRLAADPSAQVNLCPSSASSLLALLIHNSLTTSKTKEESIHYPLRSEQDSSLLVLSGSRVSLPSHATPSVVVQKSSLERHALYGWQLYLFTMHSKKPACMLEYAVWLVGDFLMVVRGGVRCPLSELDHPYQSYRQWHASNY